MSKRTTTGKLGQSIPDNFDILESGTHSGRWSAIVAVGDVSISEMTVCDEVKDMSVLSLENGFTIISNISEIVITSGTVIAYRY